MLSRSIAQGAFASGLLVVCLGAATQGSARAPLAVPRPAWPLSRAASPSLARTVSPNAKGFQVVYGFTGATSLGRYLEGGVTVDKSGNIYGTADYSGSGSGFGTVYELQRSGSTYTPVLIYEFPSSTMDGGRPYDTPALDPAGNVYVTTTGIGSNAGSVNKFTYSGSGWSQTALLSLSGGTGDIPYASPFVAGGLVYVPTEQGGPNTVGTVLVLNASDLSVAGESAFGGSNPFYAPFAALAQGPGGVLYGTVVGSANLAGGVYSYAGGQITPVFTFPLSPSGPPYPGGYNSMSPVVVDNAGNIYGTTVNGGSYSGPCSGAGDHGCGVVFKLTNSPSGYQETVLHAFTGGKDGVNPESGLALKGDTLYGTTIAGGYTKGSSCSSNACGTIFKIKTSGQGYKVIHRFQGTDGEYPSYTTLALSGKTLYGTTVQGAASSNAGGEVFSYTL